MFFWVDFFSVDDFGRIEWPSFIAAKTMILGLMQNAGAI
jgi:hypothetical protein